MFYLNVHLHTMHVPMCLLHREAGRQHKIPWNWSYTWLWITMGYWKLNPNPLQKQQTLLSTDPSLQSPQEEFLTATEPSLLPSINSLVFLFLKLWFLPLVFCSTGWVRMRNGMKQAAVQWFIHWNSRQVGDIRDMVKTLMLHKNSSSFYLASYT